MQRLAQNGMQFLVVLMVLLAAVVDGAPEHIQVDKQQILHDTCAHDYKDEGLWPPITDFEVEATTWDTCLCHTPGHDDWENIWRTP